MVASFVKSMTPESRSKIQSGLKTLVSRLDGANAAIARSVKFLVAMLDTPDLSVTDLLGTAMSEDSEFGAFFAPPAWLQSLGKKSPPLTMSVGEAPPKATKASWWKRNKDERKAPTEKNTSDVVEVSPSAPPISPIADTHVIQPDDLATKTLPTPLPVVDYPVTKTPLKPSENNEEDSFLDDLTTRRNAETEYDDLYHSAPAATNDEKAAFNEDQSARQNAESEYDDLYQTTRAAPSPDQSKPSDDKYLTNFIHDRSAEKLRERQAKRKSSQNRDGTQLDAEKIPSRVEGNEPSSVVTGPVESISVAESEPTVSTTSDTIFGDDKAVSSGEVPASREEVLPVVGNDLEVGDEYDPAQEISSLPIETTSENAGPDSMIESTPVGPVVKPATTDTPADQPDTVIDDRFLEAPIAEGLPAESPVSEEGSVDDLFMDAPETNDNIFEASADSIGKESVDSDDVFGGPPVERSNQVFEEPLEEKASTTVQDDPIFSDMPSRTQESSRLPFESEKSNQTSGKTDKIFDGKDKYEPSQTSMNVGTDFKPVKGGDLSSIDISDAVPVEATIIPVNGDRAPEMDILIVNSILMTLEYARIYRSPQVLRLISISKGQDVEKASFIGALQRATKKRVSFQFCKDILRMLFVDVTEFVEPDEIDPFEVRLFSEAQSDHTLTYERQLKSLNLTPTGRKIIRADFYFSWMTRALEALQRSSAETDLSLPFLSHFQREVTTRHANLSNYNKTVKALNSFNLQALHTASPAVLSYVKIRSEGQFWNERYKLGFSDAEADKKSLLVEFNNHNFSYYNHSSEDAMKLILQHSYIQPVPSGPGKDPPPKLALATRRSLPVQHHVRPFHAGFRTQGGQQTNGRELQRDLRLPAGRQERLSHRVRGQRSRQDLHAHLQERFSPVRGPGGRHVHSQRQTHVVEISDHQTVDMRTARGRQRR